MASWRRVLILGFAAVSLLAQRPPISFTALRAADPTLPRRIPDSIANAPIPEAFVERPLSAFESRVHRRGPLEQAGVRRAVPRQAFSNLAASVSEDGRTILTAALRSPGA